jgi:hypothetical protein
MAAVVVVGHAAGAVPADSGLAAAALEQSPDPAGQEALPAPVTQHLDGDPDAAVSARLGLVQTGPRAAPPLRLPLAGPDTGGIPAVARAAYLTAASRTPGCHLDWSVLAGIGLIESGHARGAGARSARWDGIARPPVLGPVLDGHGTAAVADSDGGALDGNRAWDRAVGPMQFLPGTWRAYGVDADADGHKDPQDVRDAAAAAADYLCAGGRDLTSPTQLISAVFSYNHSIAYARAVLGAARSYGGPSRTVDAALAALGWPPPPAPAGVTVAAPSPAPPAPRPAGRTTPAASKPAPSPSWSPTAGPTAAPTASATPLDEPTPSTSAEPSATATP